MLVMIEVPEELRHRVAELASVRGETVEDLTLEALAAYIGWLQQRNQARALVSRARARAAENPLSDNEFRAEFDNVTGAILKDAIANGTAVEDMVDDE